MSNHDLHHDWLALIEISGPFLAVPVLKEAFPQGLEELDGIKRKRLRQAYEEWREALEMDDPQFPELHAAWIDEVLARGLELDEDGKADVLKRADWCAASLNVTLPEHGVTLSPGLAVIDEQRANKPLMLIHTYGQDVDLDATLKLDGWAATPADRMVQLCRATGCRLGLVTNGERWMLIDAPIGAVTTFASWYARIWTQEPVTLQAFVHLLGIRRFFVDESEQLPALFDRSLKYQDEVTDALGEQVRRAVEVLIQALDKADQDRDRELLRDVKEPELYEAALTVMMRLVFLLSAEERGLLLLGDERYEANYALSTLRMQLRKESEEILERRWDAWSRLLAIFRAVFGGIEHENLRLPALGGSLFDPDRFPFLEGRAKGTDWRTDTAKPLPIDNRTVLLLLEAIQQFQGRTLSYRALDVEQIGYVYEGLLERTVKRTAEVTLELDGTKNAKAPWVGLAELESARLDSAERLAELLQERSGSSASRVRNDLAKPVDDALADRLLAACHGDTALRDRIKPFAHLVRTDPWGYPLVYPAGAFIVTTGSDRRETGTHYTPKSLTEAIVTETLTPIAYVGPAEGTPREQWVLKSPAELLDLKICDPAMGSGAFLVQACRWLADRLVEAWSLAEGSGKTVSVDGEVLDAPDTKEPLPRDTEARTVIARRLIAERCLYGVDLNPLAVELAKLSIWLVTLAKGRPFGFLDHNLRCGDSLLGIHRLDQLTELLISPTGKGQQRLFGQSIERAVHEAIELRQRLRTIPIRDLRDIDIMARLDAKARRKIEGAEIIADSFIGEIFGAESGRSASQSNIESLAISAGLVIDENAHAINELVAKTRSELVIVTAEGMSRRKPFHWPLEFPEVFKSGGFACVLGNPPFMGGRKIRGALGDRYISYLTKVAFPESSANSDLCAFFFRRAFEITSCSSVFSFLCTNSIGQGSTRETGLKYLDSNGATIVSAIPSMEWPGSASVTVAVVTAYKGDWRGTFSLDGRSVHAIDSYLTARDETFSPASLKENDDFAFQGSNVLGKGFIISAEEAKEIIKSDSRYAKVIRPFLRGEDFNSRPDLSPASFIINFYDWPLDRDKIEEKNAPETASDYPLCLSIVRERVYPARLKAKRESYRRRWWQYAEICRSLYRKVENLDRVIFHAYTSKHICFGFSETGIVFAGPHTVIASDCYGQFAIFQSSIHSEWAWTYCSSMRNSGVRFTPSDVRKYPRPKVTEQVICEGMNYYQARSDFMQSTGHGLTEVYNKFHDPENSCDDIKKLRLLQVSMDKAVAESYGWQDLDLNHGFVKGKQGIRFTISESTKQEIINRLLLINRNRSESSCAGNGRQPIPPKRLKPSLDGNQKELCFSDGESQTNFVSTTEDEESVLLYLRAENEWRSKAAILDATGLPHERWSAVIKSLTRKNMVDTKGSRRGARYFSDITRG